MRREVKDLAGPDTAVGGRHILAAPLPSVTGKDEIWSLP